MKTSFPYSLLLAAAASGLAYGAETAYTTPVGYENLTMNAGLNYCGLRLQKSPIVAGLLTAVTGTPSPTKTVSDSSKNFSTLLTAGTKYILEIRDAGYLQIIDGDAASGSMITTSDDLAAAGVAAGAAYIIRTADTITSVFGNVPATLAAGFGGPAGADQIYIPSPSGALELYYYDTYGTFNDPNPGPGWYRVNVDETTTLVNPSTITMPYDDGFVFNAASATSLTVSGTVKTKSTMLALASGLNYVGGISPAGATIATTFGAVPTSLATGFGGPAGADQIYVADSSGSLKLYYYDTYGTFNDPNPGAGWYRVNVDETTTLVDPALIPMSSGYVFNSASGGNVLATVPQSYSNL